MVKRFYIFFALGVFIFSSCSETESTSWELLDANGKITESGKFANELEFPYFWKPNRPAIGTLRFHYSTGFKSEETWERKNGEVYTKDVSWDPESRLYSRCQTREGKLDGPFEQRWKGKPSESGTYKDGRKVGDWREWEARSAAFVQNVYKDGDLWDGRARILIDSSGYDVTCRQGQIIEKIPCEAYLVPKLLGEVFKK